MSIIDKYNIIENHLGLEDDKKIESKMLNYFENLINSDYKLLLSDYINQALWFNKIPQCNLTENIMDQLKNYLIQRRNNMRIIIKKQNFELSGLNKFLKTFINKLETLDIILKKCDELHSSMIINEGINNLSSLIISDSIILMFIEEQIITFDKDMKDNIKTLILICKSLSKYDNMETFNKIIKTFGNIFKKQVVSTLNVPLPENIKRIQNLNNIIKYYDMINDYFQFINDTSDKLLLPIVTLIIENLVDIIKKNSLVEIDFVLSHIWLQFSKIINNLNVEDKNSIIHMLSNNITTLISQSIDIKNIFTLNNIIDTTKLIISKENNDIIIKKLTSIMSSDKHMIDVNNMIDTLIKDNIESKIITLFNFIKNVKNQDVFIQNYYQLLIKRLMNKIIENPTPEDFMKYIALEEKITELLKIQFGLKQVYKITKVIIDIKTSYNDNTEFNKLVSMNVYNTITTSYANWDVNMNEGMVHSKMLQNPLLKDNTIAKYMRNYEKYYNMRYNNKRNINWYPHYGEVSVTYLNQKLLMLPIQFMIVEMFAKEDSINIDSIKKLSFLSNYTSKFVNDIIGSLVIGNMFKIQNIQDIPHLTIMTHDTIAPNLIQVFFNTSDYAEVWEQKRQDELAHSRHDIVCSNINHILKITGLSKKVLFEQVKKNITIFELEDNVYEKALEYLILRDYIKLNNDIYEKIFY